MSAARPEPAPLPADLGPVRDEIASNLARVAGHACAGASHVQAGNDRALVCEVRCAAASLMATAALLDELRPSRMEAQA